MFKKPGLFIFKFSFAAELVGDIWIIETWENCYSKKNQYWERVEKNDNETKFYFNGTCLCCKKWIPDRLMNALHKLQSFENIHCKACNGMFKFARPMQTTCMLKKDLVYSFAKEKVFQSVHHGQIEILRLSNTTWCWNICCFSLVSNLSFTSYAIIRCSQ